MILWFLVGKMRRLPRNAPLFQQIHACCMGQLVSFLDGQLCVLAALSAFSRAGGAHERFEDPSSHTQELVEPPTRKAKVLFGEGQDALPYNPLKMYHVQRRYIVQMQIRSASLPLT